MKNGQTYTMQDDTITLNKMCGVKKEIYSLTLDRETYLRYYNGQELIQNLFRDLGVEDREFIISGWTPAEWDDLFKFEE